MRHTTEDKHFILSASEKRKRDAKLDWNVFRQKMEFWCAKYTDRSKWQQLQRRPVSA